MTEQEKVNQQMQILEAIEYQAQQLNGFIPCKESTIKEKILNYLIAYQSIISQECL